MRCRKCHAQAIYNMPRHKLALCKEHYLEWFEQYTERTIKEYRMCTRDDKILIAVSGGKDSLTLWEVLWRLGYKVDGVHVSLGIEERSYSKRSLMIVQDFAQQRGLQLLVVDLKEKYGWTISEISKYSHRAKEKPCAVCGMVKRYILNRLTCEYGYKVLATGHNLDDEVAVLFGNILNWQVGYLSRQAPVLDERQWLAKKVKPLVKFYERDTAAYALLREIKFVEGGCPFSEGASSIYYKQILNQLEEDKPGTKMRFYLGFLKAREEGLFTLTEPKDVNPLHPCESCGQPTTAPHQCAFCRFIEAIKIR